MSSLVEERELGHGIPKNVEIKTPTVCNSCFRYSKCWESDDDDMARLINEWEASYSLTKKSARHRVEEKIKYKCIRFTGLAVELEETSANRLLSGQLQHGRKMLALQLRDLSTHLDKLMKEIKGDLSVHITAEEELGKQLDQQGIEHFQIDVLSEERGARKIVCSLPERKSDFETDTMVAERLILPILEELYEEPFQVLKSVVKHEPFTHIRVTLTSAVRYLFDYGIVATSGEKSFRAGDAYEVFQIHEGLTAVLTFRRHGARYKRLSGKSKSDSVDEGMSES